MPSIPTLLASCSHVGASLLCSSGRYGLSRESPSYQLYCAQVQSLPALVRWHLFQQAAKMQLLDDDSLRVLWCEDFAGVSQQLSLSGCVLLTPACLAGCMMPWPQLRTLDLSRLLSLTDADLAAVLGRCPMLAELLLAHCHLLTSGAVADIAGCLHSTLEALSLARCWQVESVVELACCTKLRSLNLSNCSRFPSEHLGSILLACCLLQDLTLANCHQVDNVPFLTLLDGPSTLPALTSLDLQNSAAGGAALVAIALTCPRLSSLTVSFCSQLCGQGLAAFMEFRPLLSRVRGVEVAPLTALAAAGVAWPTRKHIGVPIRWTGRQDGVDEYTATHMRAVLNAEAPHRRDWAIEEILSRHEVQSPEDALSWLTPHAASLTSLDLSNADETRDSTLAWLAHSCTALRSLSLATTSVSDEGLELLGSVAGHLHTLDISGCTGSRAVSAPGSAFLRTGKRQRLARSGVTDIGIGAVLAGQQQGGPCLRALSLDGLPVTNSCLCRLAGLTSLSLQGCKRVTDQGLLQMLMRCPTLQRLALANCPALTPSTLGCPPQAINLSRAMAGPPACSSHPSHHTPPADDDAGATAMADQVLAWVDASSFSITSRGRDLTKLSLPRAMTTESTAVWLSGLLHVPLAGTGSNLHGVASALRRIDLRSVAQLTDAAVLLLVAGCPQLISLSLQNAEQLTDTAALTIASGCRLLRRLTITGAPLTDVGFAHVLYRLPGLQHLDLSRCRQLSDLVLISWALLPTADFLAAVGTPHDPAAVRQVTQNILAAVAAGRLGGDMAAVVQPGLDMQAGAGAGDVTRGATGGYRSRLGWICEELQRRVWAHLVACSERREGWADANPPSPCLSLDGIAVPHVITQARLASCANVAELGGALPMLPHGCRILTELLEELDRDAGHPCQHVTEPPPSTPARQAPTSKPSGIKPRPLRTLKLEGCTAVTNAGICAVLCVCPSMQVLWLRAMPQLTNFTVQVAFCLCLNMSEAFGV